VNVDQSQSGLMRKAVESTTIRMVEDGLSVAVNYDWSGAIGAGE
jgi:hypothetical protein